MRQIGHILICGPSGIGKTTLIEVLTAVCTSFKRLPAYTTRPKRQYERDGREYYFVDRKGFKKMIVNNLIRSQDVLRFNNHYFAFSYQLAREIGRTDKIVVAEAFHEQIRIWRKKC